MKILILTNFDVGLYKFRRELLDKLLSENNEVIVALPNGKLIPDIIALGCRYIEVGLDRRSTNPVKDLFLLTCYRAIIKRETPDVVLSYTIKPNVYGGLACRMTRTPYIANVTGLGTSIEDSGMLQKIVLKLYRTGLKKPAVYSFRMSRTGSSFKNESLTNVSELELSLALA